MVYFLFDSHKPLQSQGENIGFKLRVVKKRRNIVCADSIFDEYLKHRGISAKKYLKSEI